MTHGTEEGNRTAQHIFIIGAKSFGQYGGYETFVDRLTEQHAGDPMIRYHVACKANGKGAMDETKLEGVEVTRAGRRGEVKEFTYHNAHVFKIRCPNLGPATALLYDCMAAEYCIRYCREYDIPHPVFYILACRIGFRIHSLAKRFRALGGKYMLNPDGHEWLRSKWSRPVRAYWKWSEKKMVQAADRVICDSVHIEEYIQREYGHPDTTYIAYGADIVPSALDYDDPVFTGWLSEKGLEPGEYYLVVGRFVPENSYETMIREFIMSRTSKNLAIVTDRNDRLMQHLEETLHFSRDPRIRFAGTVYDRELLKKIREKAFAYLHGHRVGGTNPSLLEALAATDLNLLLDVPFNREAGQDAALYWTEEVGNLSRLIDSVEREDGAWRRRYGNLARARIREAYSWETIADRYRRVWLEGEGLKNGNS